MASSTVLGSSSSSPSLIVVTIALKVSSIASLLLRLISVLPCGTLLTNLSSLSTKCVDATRFADGTTEGSADGRALFLFVEPTGRPRGLKGDVVLAGG